MQHNRIQSRHYLNEYLDRQGGIPEPHLLLPSNYVVYGHDDRSRPRATFLLGEAFSLAIGIDPQTIDRPNSLGITSGVGQILDPLLNPVEWFIGNAEELADLFACVLEGLQSPDFDLGVIPS
jgi:hypothetical protein